MHSLNSLETKYPELVNYLSAYYGRPRMPINMIPWEKLDNYDMEKGSLIYR